MTDPDEPGANGLFAPFRRIAQTLLNLAQARVQLFSLELQTERLRLLDTAIKLAVALAFGAVGLFLGALTLALFVWEYARYRGLLAMTALFGIAAGFLIWRIRNELRSAPPPFAKTVEEFEKDRECFSKKN